MHSTVNILENMRKKTLCFYNKLSAQSFLRLVNTHNDESRKGSKHGAYWPNYEKRSVGWSILKVKTPTTGINSSIVESMLYEIYRARALKNPINAREDFSIGWAKNNTILFWLAELPPRIRPTVGDMYRIPRSLSQGNMVEEGRVIEDGGDTLLVIPSEYWTPGGFFRHDVKILTIRTAQAMKTHDSLKEQFPQRTSWDFDSSLIRDKHEA